MDKNPAEESRGKLFTFEHIDAHLWLCTLLDRRTAEGVLLVTVWALCPRGDLVNLIGAYLVLGAADHIIEPINHGFASIALAALVDGCVPLLDFLAAG